MGDLPLVSLESAQGAPLRRALEGAGGTAKTGLITLLELAVRIRALSAGWRGEQKGGRVVNTDRPLQLVTAWKIGRCLEQPWALQTDWETVADLAYDHGLSGALDHIREVTGSTPKLDSGELVISTAEDEPYFRVQPNGAVWAFLNVNTSGGIKLSAPYVQPEVPSAKREVTVIGRIDAPFAQLMQVIDVLRTLSETPAHWRGWDDLRSQGISCTLKDSYLGATLLLAPGGGSYALQFPIAYPLSADDIKRTIAGFQPGDPNWQRVREILGIQTNVRGCQESGKSTLLPWLIKHGVTEIEVREEAQEIILKLD